MKEKSKEIKQKIEIETKKDTLKVDRAAVRNKAVCVGEFREYANITATFKLSSFRAEMKGEIVGKTRERRGRGRGRERK